MRRRIAEVTEGARDALIEWRNLVKEDNALSDEEMATRYSSRHRGKPEQIMEFVKSHAPEDADVLEAAVEYEREMEALIRSKRRHL